MKSRIKTNSHTFVKFKVEIYKLELVNNKYLRVNSYGFSSKDLELYSIGNKSLGTLASFKTSLKKSFLEEYNIFHCINRNCFSC